MPHAASTTSKALIEAQRHSLELVVTGAPLTEVLTHLVKTVEQQAGGSAVASILLLDEERRLRNGASPSLPDDYLQAIDGLPADPNLGTCCAAAALCQVVITPDFSTSPGWKGISHLPINIGFKGAWSMPIVGRDGAVLGTFGTYFRECRGPTTLEHAVVDVLARTAAIAIERVKADVSERRAQEELRIARDQAEAASRAKSQFLAVMSHELRTPLAAIIGYADLLAAGVDGPLAEVQREHVNRMKAGAWYLVSIIDEILTFSRVEAGREIVDLESADLREIVVECADLMRPKAAEKSVDLRIATPDQPVLLKTDPGKIRQILLNLLGNALKFTDRGFVEITLTAGGDGIRLCVRDTGTGIPADKLETIFEPFVQVDQSNTRTKGGTGLGLAVSRGLAQLLGGTVEVVASEPNAGSTFELFLAHPIAAPAALGQALPIAISA